MMIAIQTILTNLRDGPRCGPFNPIHCTVPLEFAKISGMNLPESDRPLQINGPTQTRGENQGMSASQLTMDEPMRRVEAVLFLARQPLTNRRIAQLAGLEDGTQARTIIRRLNEFLDQTGRSFHIKQVAGGYQLRTRPQFSMWLRKLEHLPAPSRLTGPALETLTVVAYRQPIVKADIEAIRGVNCGEMIRQLLEKGLIRIAGRSDLLGHPFLYSTTKLFLTTFGLSSLESLPRAEKMRGTGLPSWAATDPATTPLAPDEKKPNTSTEEINVTQ